MPPIVGICMLVKLGLKDLFKNIVLYRGCVKNIEIDVVSLEMY